MSRTVELDGLVARNVRTLRAYWQMEQKEVAARMAEHYPTWTQATVSEVERGRRPLLLGEAHYLSGIFGAPISKLVSEVPL